MSDHSMFCCGRPMVTIGLAEAASELTLHSCSSCGVHRWESGGRAVDRAELLDVLRLPDRAAGERPSRTARAAADARARDDREARRLELQHLLLGFTVHGNTS